MPNMGVQASRMWVKAVVVRTRQPLPCGPRHRQFESAFDDNAGGDPRRGQTTRKATRVFGPVARELRDKNFTKRNCVARPRR